MTELLQQHVAALFAEKGWKYWPPLTILAQLTEEIGELARAVNHEFGSKPKKDTDSGNDVADEAGDVLYALACLANSCKFDLNRALLNTIDKVRTRDANRFPNVEKA